MICEGVERRAGRPDVSRLVGTPLVRVLINVQRSGTTLATVMVERFGGGHVFVMRVVTVTEGGVVVCERK